MNDTLWTWIDRGLIFIVGVFVGATAMAYICEQPGDIKPVVTVEQDGAFGRLATKPTPEFLKDSDAAPPLALEQQIAKAKADIEARFAQVERDHEARLIRVEQRNKEFAFAERKLAGVKTWDLKLGEVGK